LKKIGVDSDRASPEVMADAYRSIGDRFNSLASKYDISIDKPLKDDLSDIVTSYNSKIEGGNKINLISDTVKKIGKMKTMTGENYKNLRSQLGEAAQNASAVNKNTIHEIMSSLDDAMENSIKNVNPDDVGKWQEARKLYKNYLTIEKAMSGAGQDTAMGFVTPNQLASATKVVGGRRAYVQGNGDFHDLVRAGQAAMRGIPDSGTASRMGPLIDALGIGQVGVGIGSGNPLLMATGVGTMARRAIPYWPVQNYVGNQLLGPSGKTAKDRLLDALLAAGQGSIPLRLEDN
jgi:hypothetical protein